MSKITVMIAGLSAREGQGKMAKLMVSAIQDQPDMRLYPFGMAEERGDLFVDSGPGPGMNVRLIPTANHGEVLRDAKGIVDVVLDCTLPRSIEGNVAMYCSAGIPFVTVTTGGDRVKMADMVKNSTISALFTVNAAKHVVAVQEMIRFVADNFPDLFKGFNLLIEESHQAAKADPSGMAINLLPAFGKLGVPYTKEQVADHMERDPVVQQIKWGIPKEKTSGHGEHIFSLLSPDGNVLVQVRFRILGREPYVDGVLADIRFLHSKKGIQGQVYTQLDQMRGSA